jgi:hypothetical protein
VVCLAGINYAVVKELGQLDVAFKDYAVEHGISWGAQFSNIDLCLTRMTVSQSLARYCRREFNKGDDDNLYKGAF